MGDLDRLCELRGYALEGRGCTQVAGLRYCAKRSSPRHGRARDCTTINIETVVEPVISGGTPAPTPTPGAAATTFATPPSVHFHPNSQAATVTKSGGQVVAAPDLRGLAALSGFAADGTTVVGPLETVDALGRKFWRFNGTQYATLANTLAALSSRGYMAAIVGRVPHARNTVNMFNPRYASYTSDASNAPANSSIGFLKATVTSLSAPGLQGCAPGALTNATDGYKGIPGAQLQVMAVASRTTANGGQRIYINNDKIDVAQATTLVTGYLGAIIAASAGAANTAEVTTSVNNALDVYEIAMWNAEVVNANSDAAIAAMVANFAIAQLDANLLTEGDSITDGVPTSYATNPAYHGSVASALCNPGAMLVPANYRVLNLGTSGSVTAGVVARRDAVNAIASAAMYPGGPSKNKMIVQLGQNDMSQSIGQKNSTMFYADMVAIGYTAGTGYLQRGWSVYYVANIGGPATAVTTNVSPAGENTTQKRIEGFRALIADTVNHTPTVQLLADTQSAVGQTYAGLVGVVHVYDIVKGGVKYFDHVPTVADIANAVPPGPYDADLKHLVAEGYVLEASGGDTPQYGYRSVV